MSWKGIPKKEFGVPLFPEEWNAVVDALDELYWKGGATVGRDIIPDRDARYDIGKRDRRFRNVFALFGYFDNAVQTSALNADTGNFTTSLTVGGKEVLTKEDPLNVYIQAPLPLPVKIVAEEVRRKGDSWLVDTAVESSPKTLFTPEAGYKPKLKSWLLICDSNTGEVWLYFPILRKTAGWLPCSVLKKASNPNCLIEGYANDPMLLYWNGVGAGSKVLVQLTWEEEYTGIMPPERLDPNDPLWMPAGGWDSVWEFDSDAELNDFANAGQQYAYTEDGLLKFNPPSGDYGCAVRSESGVYYTKAATSFRVPSVVSASNLPYVVIILKNDGSTSYGAMVAINTSDPSKLQLVDYGSGSAVDFAWSPDSFVLVVDFATNTARVYDQNKNVVAEITMTPYSESIDASEIYIYESKYDGDDFETEVDWVAVKR